jgi:fused signal recognition particle receptor
VSLWDRIVTGLAKSRDTLAAGFQGLVGGSARGSAVSFEDLEAAMIQADIGVRATDRLLTEIKRSGATEPGEVRRRLRSLIAASLQPKVAAND